MKSERPCIACGRSPTQKAHLINRSQGGRGGPTVPLCLHHHGLYDTYQFDLVPYLEGMGVEGRELIAAAVVATGLEIAYWRLRGKKEDGSYTDYTKEP